jgi:type III secretion protein J
MHSLSDPFHRHDVRHLDRDDCKRKSLSRLHSCVLLVVAVLLTGCSKQLLGALDEVAANQVVSVLRLEGVDASKSAAGEKFWKVTVTDDQFADAVQILERHNLPPPQFHGLGQVFKKESLVSTPTEERARLIYAMSQELERSLGEIDGVLVARVHPVILPYDPLNPKRSTATASVLIKYRAGVDISGRESMVRSLVAAGIEGLNYDDVRVVMVPAEVRPALAGPSASGWASAASFPSLSTAGSHALTRFPAMYGGVVATLLAALALSYAWVRWRRLDARAAAGLRGRWANTISGFIGEHDRDVRKESRRRSGGSK